MVPGKVLEKEHEVVKDDGLPREIGGQGPVPELYVCHQMLLLYMLSKIIWVDDVN